MASVEDLINEMPLIEDIAQEKQYFLIDDATREISIPDSLAGVESDEKAKRLYFKCPKVVGDNLDLTTLSLRVNFENANLEKDQYIVEDVAADGAYITFSWLLSRKVTKYKGVVRFIICAVKTNDDGVIQNEWNTTLAEIETLEGLEVDQPQPPEETTDIIEQLLKLIKQEGETQVSRVTQTGNEQLAEINKVADEIKNWAYSKQECDYKYTVAPRQEKTSDTGTMELTDADNGLAGVSMKGNSFQYESTGKNLFKYRTNITSAQKGVTLTTDENYKIILNGTATETAFFGFTFADNEVPSGTYRISLNNEQTNKDVSIKLNGSSGDIFTGVGATVKNLSQVANLTSDCTGATIRVGAGATLNNFVLYPMLSAGEDSLSFEPYSGGEPGPNPDYPFPVQSVGDIPKDSNGVEIRNLLDEEVLRNATLGEGVTGSTATKIVEGITFSEGVYKTKAFLKGVPQTDSSGTVMLLCINKSTTGNRFIRIVNNDGSSLEKTITVGEGETAYLAIRDTVGIENVCDNYNIMITTASEIDEYRPYIGENNGLIKIETQGKNLIDVESPALTNFTNPIISNNCTGDVMLMSDSVSGSAINFRWVVYVVGKASDYIGKEIKLKIDDYIGDTSLFKIGLGHLKSSALQNGYVGVTSTSVQNKVLSYLVEDKEGYDTIGVILYINNINGINRNVIYKGVRTYEGSILDNAYTPYQHSTTWVTLKEPLRKIGDVADEILKDGTVVQRIGLVHYKDLGEDVWSSDSNFLRDGFCYAYPVKTILLSNSPVLSNYLPYYKHVFAKESIVTTDVFSFYLKLTRLGLSENSTKQEVINAVKNYVLSIEDGYINYQLATPTTYTIPRILVETYDPTTDITVQSEIKPSMTVDYKIAISSILRRLEALENPATLL